MAFLFALAMGVSRVYLSVHYATDVIGAIVTGGVGGILGYLISLRIPDTFYDGDIHELKNVKLSSLKPTVSASGKHEAPRRSAERPPRREIVLDGESFSDRLMFACDGFYGRPEFWQRILSLAEFTRGFFQEVGKTYSWHDAEERFMLENARRLFPEFAALGEK